MERRDGWKEEVLLQKFPLTALLSKPNETRGWCDWDYGFGDALELLTDWGLGATLKWVGIGHKGLTP